MESKQAPRHPQPLSLPSSICDTRWAKKEIPSRAAQTKYFSFAIYPSPLPNPTPTLTQPPTLPYPRHRNFISVCLKAICLPSRHRYPLYSDYPWQNHMWTSSKCSIWRARLKSWVFIGDLLVLSSSGKWEDGDGIELIMRVYLIWWNWANRDCARYCRILIC
jgi:hypothetical protein